MASWANVPWKGSDMSAPTSSPASRAEAAPLPAPDAPDGGHRAVDPWIERYRVAAVTGRGSVFTPRMLLLVVAVVAVLLYASSATSSIRYSVIVGVVMAFAVLGNNAVLGLLGEINLAAGAFVALGAYTFAYLLSQDRSVPLAMIVAVLLCLVVGAVLAVPTTRLTGIFTALVTFALASAVPSLVVELDRWTGGQRGLSVPFDATFLGMEVTGSSPGLLYLVTGLFLVLGLAALVLLRSRVGRLLLTVGEVRQAAECFGVATRRWEVGIWSVAAGLGGLCGCLYALAVGYLTPEVFPLFLSISLLVGAFVGGPRAPLGALVGGVFVATIPPNIQSIVPAEATGMLFGLAMFAMLFAGGLGLVGWLEKLPVVLRRFSVRGAR